MNEELKFKVEKSLEKVKSRLEECNFSGYEMFDGLNSPFFNNFIFNKSKFLRLCITQFFKRTPFNLRPFLMIPKTQDIKALALSLMSYVSLGDKDKCDYLYQLILSKRANNTYVWGYTWSYQLLAFYAKKDCPNIIATGFVLDAFLEYYIKYPNENIKEKIFLISKNIIDQFYLKNKNYFAYFPDSDFAVYNAIAIASYILAKANIVLETNNYKNEILNSINYVIKKQNSDGSWNYGDLKNHSFIDNFHTIYNLQCLKYIGENLKYEKALSSYSVGKKYYLNSFFSKNNLPKYFHNSLYPLDIHCFASSIIFLSQIKEREDILENLLNFVIDEMQLESGDFIFRIEKYWKNKNVYVRWSNAWMFYALSVYLKTLK